MTRHNWKRSVDHPKQSRLCCSNKLKTWVAYNNKGWFLAKVQFHSTSFLRTRLTQMVIPEKEETMMNHVLALKTSVWRDRGHACSRWVTMTSHIATQEVEGEIKISLQGEVAVTMNNNAIYCCKDLYTRPYMNWSFVFYSKPFSTTCSCCSCHTTFFIFPFLPQGLCTGCLFGLEHVPPNIYVTPRLGSSGH